MATGMQMLLKQLGFDPEQITNEAKKIGELIVAFKAQNDQILDNQRRIMEHLGIEFVQPQEERLLSDGTETRSSGQHGRAGSDGHGSVGCGIEGNAVEQ